MPRWRNAVLVQRLRDTSETLAFRAQGKDSADDGGLLSV
jgi:hypothetical protein